MYRVWGFKTSSKGRKRLNREGKGKYWEGKRGKWQNQKLNQISIKHFFSRANRENAKKNSIFRPKLKL